MITQIYLIILILKFSETNNFKLSGIYIHIPFCGKRCTYCDFYLITNLNLIDKFLLNLENEITLSSKFLKKENFDTIFFGGGTPSLLSHIQISQILNHLHKNFNISKDSEITIEANPEDFIEKNLSDYRTAGVNRMSFGVQSFRDDELKFLTRRHTADEAERVVKMASQYFDNISLDIIYSLPSQTNAQLNYSLDKAISLNVNHISAYTLTYEKNTVLYKSLERNLVKKNSEPQEAELYNYVSGKLTSSGFNHYEVSNFAKEKFECRHNLKYWRYKNYAGFGPSAHSMVNGRRWNNVSDIAKYNSLLEKNILPIEQKYELSNDQKKLEYLMLALRSTGLDFENYRKLFHEDPEEIYSESISELIENNFAYVSGGIFRLNERGYVMADEIVAKYF